MDLAEIDFGPKMRALRTDKQRRFVLAMIDNPGILPSAAAEMAGYVTGEQGGSDDPERKYLAHKQSAWRLLQDPTIQEALHEAAGRRMRSGALLAADVLVGLAANEDVKPDLRLKAASTLLDRIGFAGEQTINVVKSDMTGAAMLERIRALAARLGVDEGKLLGGNVNATKVAEPVMIDVTPEVKDGE